MKNPFKLEKLRQQVAIQYAKRRVSKVEKEQGKEAAGAALISIITAEMIQVYSHHQDWTAEKLADYDDNMLCYFAEHSIDKQMLIQFAETVINGMKNE